MPDARFVKVFAIVTIVLLAGCGMHRGAHSAHSPQVTYGADLQRGKAVYAEQCQACHGVQGAGGPVGPSLRGERERRSFDRVTAIVLDPEPPMPKLYPAQINANDVRDVSAYVESL